jgi:hypothetical protein
MLDMMAFTSQSSYSWKHKIETSQSRPTWAESKTLCPKYQSRKVWRHGSRAGFLPSKHKILSSNPSTGKKVRDVSRFLDLREVENLSEGIIWVWRLL